MKISIIGASSGIGLFAVKNALKRGHQVTTLSRNIKTLPEDNSITKIVGSATSKDDLKKAISGADAVIITIGKSKDKAPALFPDTGRTLIQVVAELQLTIPFIIITGFGTGESKKFANSLLMKIVGVLLKKEYEYKTEMEELLAESKVRWEIVRPGLLTNGPFTGQYKIIPELYKGLKVKSISREDVADFLLNQAENPSLILKHVTLTS